MFITTNVKNKVPLFKNDAYARIAVETLYNIQHFYAFFLFGFVIMPDHCHLLLRVPEGGSISKTMNVYKRAVTFNVGGERFWQTRFHMRIPNDTFAALNYIHMNPVKAGFCENPEDYPWSSASGKWDVTPLSF